MEASAYEPVRKHWTTEGELVSSRKSLLAIGGMRAGTRLRQGVEPNGQPPRIQVALATGKLVLPEQKGVVRRNPIKTRCEDQPLNKAEIRRGASDERKRGRDAARTYHEPCCWSEPD